MKAQSTGIAQSLDILECPNTKTSLRWSAKGDLASADGAYVYPVRDGIACFVSNSAGAGLGDADSSQTVRQYYEERGWQAGDEAIFDDTRVFVDTRDTPMEYTRKCIARLNKYFATGGRFLADAGSGPIPHNELMNYSAQFAHRICIDFSFAALRLAKAKIGESGVYLQSDITNLPIKSSSVDAVTCNHVIYHVPAEKQAAAFRELWRIVRPGGVAVVVYAWKRSPIAGGLRRVAKLLRRRGRSGPMGETQPDIYYAAHSLDWFQSQQWPFRYKLDTFRVIDNDFMRRYVSDGWLGRATLQSLYVLQQMLPGFCGRFGAYPAIVIYKD